MISAVQEVKEKTEKYIQTLKKLKNSAMKHLFTYGAVSFKDKYKVELKTIEIG